LDEGDEDIKNLLNSVESNPSTSTQRKDNIWKLILIYFNLFLLLLLAVRSSSSSKRIRRISKTSTIHNKNNEFIFDEEHLIELLKRLKQQTSNDESDLFETLISMYQKFINNTKF